MKTPPNYGTEILPGDPVRFIPNFIADPNAFFDVLWNDLNWERRENTPRREYWTNIYDRPYTYGNGLGERTYESRPTHGAIETVADELEAMLGFRYEGCFLNGYETSADSLGPHADDDDNIDHDYGIAVVTVGDGRELEYIDVETKRRTRVFLSPGSLLYMEPGMQSTHLHRIPRASFVVKKPRISLTFRKLFATAKVKEEA